MRHCGWWGQPHAYFAPLAASKRHEMSCLVDLQIRGCFSRVSSVLEMDLTRSPGKFLLCFVCDLPKCEREVWNARFREFDNDVCGYRHQNFCMDGEITKMGILNCLSRVKSQYQGTYWAQAWISRTHNRLHICSQQWCWGGRWFWGRLVRLGLGLQLVGYLMWTSSMYPIGEDTWLQAERNFPG